MKFYLTTAMSLALMVTGAQAGMEEAKAFLDAEIGDMSSLDRAAHACLAGELDGLVTGPVHKAAINAGGIAYTGTTELLAAHARCDVVMMLANDIVRVALATAPMICPTAVSKCVAQLLTSDLRALICRCALSFCSASSLARWTSWLRNRSAARAVSPTSSPRVPKGM